MLIRLIPMGDSAGVNIPNAMLEQIGAGSSVELQAEDGRLVIRAAKTSRQQWEEALVSLLESVDGAGSLGEVPDLPRRGR